MDALDIFARIMVDRLMARGDPRDEAEAVVADALLIGKRQLGGSMHHISRVQHIPLKARIIELGAAGLGPRQISERVGVSRQYVYQVLASLRQEGCQQDDPGN